MARTLNNEVDILNIASLDNDIKDSFTRAMISEDVNTTSAAARKYLEGEYFIHNDRCLYKALEEIAAGTTITPDVNAELVTVSEELVRLFAQSPEGIFEILSNVQDGDTATRSFVKGEQIIWKDKQLYKVTADVVSGGAWVVGTNIALAENLTSQIKTLTNQTTANTNNLSIVRSQISDDSDEYSSQTPYFKGDFCIHDNKVYECITDCSAAAWDVNVSCFKNSTILEAIHTDHKFIFLSKTVTVSASTETWGGYYCYVNMTDEINAAIGSKSFEGCIPLSATYIGLSGIHGLLGIYNSQLLNDKQFSLNAGKAGTYRCDFLVIFK